MNSPPTPAPTEIARRLGLQARRFLDRGERVELDAALCGRLLGIREVASADSIAVYAAMPDEVDLAGAFAALEEAGTGLLLPRVVGDALEFAAWSPGEELIDNRFGIGEPAGDAVGVEMIDVIVMPCVAVDRKGCRVGFGAGFYDRTLGPVMAAGHRPTLIAAAYEVQVMEAIEQRPWDVPVDAVVTDTRVLRPL